MLVVLRQVCLCVGLRRLICVSRCLQGVQRSQESLHNVSARKSLSGNNSGLHLWGIGEKAAQIQSPNAQGKVRQKSECNNWV